MTHDFTGKVALVIGGSRGIGAAIGRRLSADGAALAFTYLRRRTDAARFEREIGATGARVIALCADAADPAMPGAVIDQTMAAFGRLDILVNNAGLAITGALDAYPDDAFDRTFATNVRAPFLASQRAASVMTAGGRILTIGSIVATRMPGPGGTLYAASKAALGGMTRGMARDLGAREITVNLIQPGPIDTERNPADGPHADQNRQPLAIPRHGKADEVAALVAFLASDEAAFITGAVYNIDGGWSA